MKNNIIFKIFLSSFSLFLFSAEGCQESSVDPVITDVNSMSTNQVMSLLYSDNNPWKVSEYDIHIYNFKELISQETYSNRSDVFKFSSEHIVKECGLFDFGCSPLDFYVGEHTGYPNDEFDNSWFSWNVFKDDTQSNDSKLIELNYPQSTFDISSSSQGNTSSSFFFGNSADFSGLGNFNITKLNQTSLEGYFYTQEQINGEQKVVILKMIK